MADFKKLLDHPEKQKIINKLLSGDLPKDVAQYLKLKYTKDDETHLRLSINLLQEFKTKHLDKAGFLQKIVQADQDGKLDKAIAESLLANKEWKDRLAEYIDDEIDLKKEIRDLLHILKARAEQVFDKIQESPGNIKLDYVMAKYFELLGNVIEKADKIINERPDQRIEHTHTVQVVEEYSIVLQETIRELLLRMGPEYSATFMEMLADKMNKLKNPSDGAVSIQALGKKRMEFGKLSSRADILDAEIGEIISEGE